MYRPKHIVEYLLLRGVAAAVSLLPYRGALLVGWALAGLTHYGCRFRAREARRRIREVFGAALSDRAVARIAWLSWRNFVFAGVETLRLPRLRLRWGRRVADCAEMVDTLKRHAATGQGAIVPTLHMGGWELGGALLAAHGVPLFFIFAEQKNPLFNRFLLALRTSRGADFIPRGSGTMKAVLRKLKSGGMLGMPVDVRAPVESVPVRFLGKQANVGAGMAAFARHAGVPVLPCLFTRVGWARHNWRIFDPVFPDPDVEKQADIRRMTQAVFDLFEPVIREQPDQWFWYNKRWLLDPLGENAEPGTRSAEGEKRNHGLH